MRGVLLFVDVMGEGIESKLLLSKVEDVLSNKLLFNFTCSNKDNKLSTIASMDQALGAFRSLGVLPPIWLGYVALS